MLQINLTQGLSFMLLTTIALNQNRKHCALTKFVYLIFIICSNNIRKVHYFQMLKRLSSNVLNFLFIGRNLILLGSLLIRHNYKQNCKF